MQDKESQLFGLLEAWSQAFNIPTQTLRQSLRYAPFVETCPHEDGPSAPAYAEHDVRRFCADLIPPNSEPTFP